MLSNKKLKVYLIPGLGFTFEFFKKLKLEAFEQIQLNWIEPEKGESFSDYAKRFSTQINAKDKVVILGHSLGGMLAQELAIHKSIDAIVLLSSLKSREELPFYFKVIAPLHMHRLFNKQTTIMSVKYWGRFHDMPTKEEQDLFGRMVGSYSNDYLQWALRSLSKWRPPNVNCHTRIFSIHGTNDKTLPFRLLQDIDVVIEGGSHFMAYSQAELISDKVLPILEAIQSN